VIIPTHNRPDDLERCLRSLQSLTHPNWQAIVVNDGSTVSYEETLKKFETDKRIRYIALAENRGVNYVRNTALDSISPATTDVIGFIDDDDYFIPDALSIAMQMFLGQTINWLVLQCFLNNKKKTYMSKSGEMDYVNDCMYGSKLKGDATHFIRAQYALSHRFSRSIRNGQEWLYFISIAAECTLFAEMTPVKHAYYKEDGLSRRRKSGRELLVSRVMKVYRPWRALQLRPTNMRALLQLVTKVLFFPFALLNILVVLAVSKFY